MKSETLFVYGALRQGASNEWRMKDAPCLGEAEVRGVLVKVDWYPGLVIAGEGESLVKGEVYEVGPDLLGELDEFEGISLKGESNGEYQRVRATVNLRGEEREVWIYEWLKGVSGYQVVTSGDWLNP